MSGYTKGPWEAVGHLIRTARTAQDKRGIGIGEALLTNPNRKDDARLMAAAPELLDALQAARTRLPQKDSLPNTDTEVGRIVAQVDAAIRKATEG